MTKLIKLLLLLASLCFSCTQQNQTTALQITKLEKEIEVLKSAIAELKQDRSWDEFVKSLESTAYLTPGAGGYSVIQCDLGRMTVQLNDVKPYANGSKITLRIGNLTTATVNGAKAKIEWGSVNEKGIPINESAKNRDFNFNKPLRPGTWNHVTVILEGVPPVQLGFVRIREMTHTGIVLKL